jgi:hypothetical protein
MLTPQDLVTRLSRHIDYTAAWTRKLDSYLHGRQPLAMLPESVLADCGDRLPQIRINFARMVVDSLEERLDVAGFKAPDDAVSDTTQEIWQRNNLDEFSQMAHYEALAHGRSFIMVWADATGYPRITVESARQTTVWHMPGSTHRIAALKRWVTPDGRALANLFLPDRILKFQSPSRITVDPYLTEAQLFMTYSGYDPYAWWDFSQIPATGWELRADPIPNPFGVVPVIPLTNRPRILNWGESELIDVLPIVDAINKLATDMMISSEYFATPRRWVTGIEIQTDEAGAPVDPFSKTRGRNWLAEDEATKFGEFSTAELTNFTNAITALTQQLGAIAGLPPHYLGISREPASADAIRSSEAPLTNKARRRMRAFGGSWETAMRLAMAILDGYVRPGLESMECVWADPESRTIAQQADAATKLSQIGVPMEQLAEDLGYSPQEITKMAGVVAAPTNGAGAPLPDSVETQREIRRDENAAG